MSNKKINIKTNISLKEYQKKHKNFSYKLMNFTEKEVNDFDKANGTTDKSLLKGKKWCKINGKYYQLPKASAFNWFRNLNAAGKTAVCLLTCGVVAGASATPFLIRKGSGGGDTPISDVHVKPGQGLTDVITKKDATTGNIEITVTPKEVTKGINKDSVTVSYKKDEVETVLEEDQYTIEEDTKVIISEEVQEEHPGEELTVTLNSIVTDTPDQYEVVEEQNPETGEMETVAEVDVQEVEEPGEELAIPSKEKKSGRKRKIDKVRVKASNKRKEKTKKLTLSDDIKNVVSSDQNKGPFEDFINLLNARIPDNLEKLVKYFFKNCEKLEKLKGGKNTKEIDDEAFKNVLKLQKLILKNVEKIGAGAFEVSDEKIALGKKSLLENVHVSDKLGVLEKNTFRNNEKLKDVKGGKKATEVKEKCCENCFSLEHIDLLDSEFLLKVGLGAFRNTALTQLRINKDVDSDPTKGFNFGAFANNGHLADIYINSEKIANQGKDSEKSKGNDVHGALTNAKNVYVTKTLTLDPKSDIASNYAKNDKKSTKDYDCYEPKKNTNYTYTVYNDNGDRRGVSHKYIPGEKERNVTVTVTEKEKEQINALNSHGYRDNKTLSTIDLRELINLKWLGTDFKNGYTFANCEKLIKILGLDKVVAICAYCFAGTSLGQFVMPRNVSRENLGDNAFKDHKTKKMELTLQRQEDEREEAKQLYNNEDDNSGMFEASETVNLPEDAGVSMTSYLMTHFEQKSVGSGKQVWKKKTK